MTPAKGQELLASTKAFVNPDGKDRYQVVVIVTDSESLDASLVTSLAPEFAILALMAGILELGSDMEPPPGAIIH
jgi:hypothetical protein